jgi:hypothetical protein
MGDLSKYVKPLDWEDFEGRGAKAQAFCHASYLIQRWSGRGQFEVSHSYPGYQTAIDHERFNDTLEAAKAAAQADYARRILEAADLDAAHLAGVKAGLKAAAQVARGEGESEFFNPVQAIRALDPDAIAREPQKENPNG